MTIDPYWAGVILNCILIPICILTNSVKKDWPAAIMLMVLGAMSFLGTFMCLLLLAFKKWPRLEAAFFGTQTPGRS